MACAHSFLDISLENARRSRNPQALLAALSFVEQVLCDQEQFADASAIAREHLAVAIEIGGKGETTASLQALGDTLVMLQAYHPATTLWEASSATHMVLAGHDLFTWQTTYEAIRIKEQPEYQKHALLRKEQTRQQVGGVASDTAWAAGQALTLLEEGIEPGTG
jgi:hypothetical protein